MGIDKRQRLGLIGLLPARVETLDTQKARALRVLRSKTDFLEKYILMAQLRTTNVRLFYKIIIDELEVIKKKKNSPNFMTKPYHFPKGTCSRHLHSDCRYSLFGILYHLSILGCTRCIGWSLLDQS
jgi:hypothetical protein